MHGSDAEPDGETAARVDHGDAIDASPRRASGPVALSDTPPGSAMSSAIAAIEQEVGDHEVGGVIAMSPPE